MIVIISKKDFLKNKKKFLKNGKYAIYLFVVIQPAIRISQNSDR